MINEKLKKEMNKQLLNAAEKGELSTVEKLLKEGVDIDYCTAGWGITALMIAVCNRHIDIIKILIKKGADVNHVDKDGCTALIFATRDDRIKIVELLKKSGAK